MSTPGWRRPPAQPGQKRCRGQPLRRSPPPRAPTSSNRPPFPARIDDSTHEQLHEAPPRVCGDYPPTAQGSKPLVTGVPRPRGPVKDPFRRASVLELESVGDDV